MLRLFARLRPGEQESFQVLSKRELQFSCPSSAQPGASRQSGSRRGESGDSASEDAAPYLFHFDEVFGPEATSEDLYASLRGHIVGALDGGSACVFAYGARGSGKTQTITGLLERLAQELEGRMRHSSTPSDVVVQAVEVHGDQLVDLLGPNEPARRQIHLPRLATLLTLDAETPGGVAEGLRQAWRFAQAQRVPVDSRSMSAHLVLTLFLRSDAQAAGPAERNGRLTLVDLAACERAGGLHGGLQGREALNVHRSLAALADVLVAREKRDPHIPYRSSKLTQLLQEALGGQEQCHTAVITTLSPGRPSLSENLYSLQFSAKLLGLRTACFSKRRSVSLPRASRLRLELTRWRSECEKIQVRLADCQGELQRKEKELKAVRRKNAELMETARGFERNNMELLHGFASMNRTLQDLEAITLEEEPEFELPEELGIPQLGRRTSRSVGGSPAARRPSIGCQQDEHWAAERRPSPFSRLSYPSSSRNGHNGSQASSSSSSLEISVAPLDFSGLQKKHLDSESCDTACALSPCMEGEDVDTSSQLSSPSSSGSGRLSSWHSSPCPDNTSFCDTTCAETPPMPLPCCASQPHPQALAGIEEDSVRGLPSRDEAGLCSQTSISISVSSDEATMRNRWRQSLLQGGANLASSGGSSMTAAPEKVVAAPVPKTGRGATAWRAGAPTLRPRRGSPGSLVLPSARPLNSPPPPSAFSSTPPAHVPPVWRAQLPWWLQSSTPRPPHSPAGIRANQGGSTARPASWGHRVQASTPEGYHIATHR